MKKTILILFAIAGFTTMQAQNFGEIHGNLIGPENGEPVLFTSVSVTNGVNTYDDFTDDKGKFKFKALNPGTYTLRVTSAEYSELNVSGIVVTPDNITFQDNLMMSINLLGVVNVIGHTYLIKKDNPALISILPADLKHNAAAKNPMGMIAQLPGITGGGVDGQELYFRGSRPQSISTFIDGVKLLTSGISNIPSNAIKNVSVYTGGVPAQYGDVTGGVIILETKSYMDFYNEINH